MTIAGDGTELRAAQAYVRRRHLEGVQWLGWVTGEAKRQAMNQADLYLFPSYTEGMPNSVLEAMACGLPVVTRPVGGLVDFFENGRMGLMTESLAPGVFVDLIGKLVKDPPLRHRMGAFNRAYARRRFLASNVAKRIEAIYTEILEAKR